MVRFGPSGDATEIVEQKLSKEKYAELMKINDVDAFEISCTKGVSMGKDTALKYREIFASRNIKLSVHAPYYINFANPDDFQIEKSNQYLLDTLLLAKTLGANRVVFHPGTTMKQNRKTAMNLMVKNIRNFITLMKINDVYENMYICPETMGKHGQMGTWKEVAELCKIDSHIIPTLDFGHINCFTLGSLKNINDYFEIFEKFIIENGIKQLHIHFSRIEFSEKGEKKHLNFCDESDFGPDYKIFLDALKEYDSNTNIDVTVICESRGDQFKDSITMLKYYKK